MIVEKIHLYIIIDLACWQAQNKSFTTFVEVFDSELMQIFYVCSVEKSFVFKELQDESLNHTIGRLTCFRK